MQQEQKLPANQAICKGFCTDMEESVDCSSRMRSIKGPTVTDIAIQMVVDSTKLRRSHEDRSDKLESLFTPLSRDHDFF